MNINFETDNYLNDGFVLCTPKTSAWIKKQIEALERAKAELTSIALHPTFAEANATEALTAIREIEELK